MWTLMLAGACTDALSTLRACPSEDEAWQLPLHENVRGPTYYH